MRLVGEYVTMRRSTQTRKRLTQADSSGRMERSIHQSRILRSGSSAADEGEPYFWIYLPSHDEHHLLRICPGRHFALRNLHLVIANVLTAFDILPPLDKNGNPQPPPPEFKHSQVRSVRSCTLVRSTRLFCDVMHRHPLPFNCVIKPRSEKSFGLVKELYSQYWS